MRADTMRNRHHKSSAFPCSHALAGLCATQGRITLARGPEPDAPSPSTLVPYPVPYLVPYICSAAERLIIYGCLLSSCFVGFRFCGVLSVLRT